MTRIIAHLDMDAFFAAVEERDRPRLKGKPIVIGADPQEGRGRGIVATANYPARKYGIHSAMPITRAWRASEEAKRRGEPEVVFIQGNHKKYSEVSKRIFEIVEGELSKSSHSERSEESHKQRSFANAKDDAHKVTQLPYVTQTSIDEAYFDLSYTGSFKKAEEISKKIKGEIKRKEKLTASVGIGPNKLIAKISSDMQKPDGLTVVLPEQVEAFLDPLSIRKIPGIGPKTEKLLSTLGVKTVKDIKKYSQKELAEMLGQWGLSLYKKARGIDNSPVYEESEIKSIGEQETFMEDTLYPSVIFSSLEKMCDNIIKRLMQDGFTCFRTVVITVRFDNFQTLTRSKTLEAPAKTKKELAAIALQLLLPFLDKRENPKQRLIRLIGVRIEKFTSFAPSKVGER